MNNASDAQTILNLIDSFNTLSEQAEYSLQIGVQATGTAQVILNDGGMVGSTYIAKVPHNLGYAPMFIAYTNNAGQYHALPMIPVLDGGGATIHYRSFAYADATNLNLCMNFFAPTVGLGPTNNGPFYSAGDSFPFAYFILHNPIAAN